MRTYRIFDCNHAEGHPSDILIFGPEWLARFIAALKGAAWDYQSEASYQRHYARAQADARQ